MPKPCNDCRIVHPPLVACLAALHEAVLQLLQQIAAPGRCKGCGCAIFWVKHRNGKAVPYTPYGQNHFIDCPEAKEFKR